MNGENTSLDINTPTSKLLEKSGKGNNRNPPIKPIIIGLVGGFLLFPFPDFSKSLLVGVLMSKDIFSPFVSQSLLFLSFIVATFLPVIILKIKRN